MKVASYIAACVSLHSMYGVMATPTHANEAETQIDKRQPADIPNPNSYQYQSGARGAQQQVPQDIYDQIEGEMDRDCEWALANHPVDPAHGLTWSNDYPVQGGAVLHVTVRPLGNAAIVWDLVQAATFALFGGEDQPTLGAANRWYREPFYHLRVQRDFGDQGNGGDARTEDVAEVEITVTDPQVQPSNTDFALSEFELQTNLQVPNTIALCKSIFGVSKKRSVGTKPAALQKLES